MVANLPFNITTDALKRLLPLGRHVGDVLLLLQEEAARRLALAQVGGADYRAINVRLGRYARSVRYVLTVSRAAFFPEPHVDAGLVALQLRPPAPSSKTPPLPAALDDENAPPPALAGASAASGAAADQERAWVALVEAAFLSRRKMLRNNLAPGWPPAAVARALAAAGLAEDARAQELTAAHFAKLFNALPPREGGGNRGGKPAE